MNQRNYEMLKDVDTIAALYNGLGSGGTANALKLFPNKRIVNFW